MRLTGTPLLVLIGLLTVAAPITFAVVRRRVGMAGRTWRGAVGRLAAVLACQALAVSLTFLLVNNSFAFYSSWGDLLGTSSPSTQLSNQSLVGPGQGRVEVVQVHGRASGANEPVLIWLPPQYDDPAYAKTKFPVTMVLPGQPSTPGVMFRHFDFARNATQAIADHLAKPFIAVFPPLMTDPPRDTECTDVPGGPQAETWLDHDVYGAVDHDLRTDGKPWTEIGWSTGAFCAAKLMLGHPTQYRAAVGLGGYYAPLTDKTTGNLFGGRAKVRQENSPNWLYRHAGGTRGRALLLVAGAEDRESYRQTQDFLTLAAGDPRVSSIVFPVGGHNYRNYASYLPSSLQWLFAPRSS